MMVTMRWNGFFLQTFVRVVLVTVAMHAVTARIYAVENPATSRPVDGADLATSKSPDELDDDNEDTPAGDDDEATDDLLDMDLDQLTQADVVVSAAGEMLNTEVSTVARQEVTIARTPAAVYVVTQDMIRRSGARNVMEVLRRVPGLHVARINANSWAISIRGFNGAYTDKLLVQIDGRAIYTPLFSGTFWEMQLVPLKDVERIEVVRGPGSSVWGANAVNGVINIVTKDTADTVGAYAEFGGGSEHRSFSHGRVGGRLGENATYRVYGTHMDDDQGLILLPGHRDARHGGQGGFRVDWRPWQGDQLTLQGDFGGLVFETSPSVPEVSMGNFLTRWTRQVDCNTDWTVQTYYDYSDTNFTPASTIVERVGQTVFDVDVQRRARRGRHDIVSGVGYRNYGTYVRTQPGQALDYIPDADTFDIISYFGQDTITLREDRLYLTMGCKFEHTDFAGFNFQPSIKLACTPDERTSIWGSVSRSVRTPSVMNRDLLLLSPLGGGAFLRLAGNPAIDQEQAMTYELGMRRQATDRFYWDLAAYFSRYDDLTRAVGTGISLPFFDATFLNSGAADTYGFEWWGTYELADWQRLRGFLFVLSHRV